MLIYNNIHNKNNNKWQKHYRNYKLKQHYKLKHKNIMNILKI